MSRPGMIFGILFLIVVIFASIMGACFPLIAQGFGFMGTGFACFSFIAFCIDAYNYYD